MIANPDNRHKKREREKTGSGHPQPHCALIECYWDFASSRFKDYVTKYKGEKHTFVQSRY